MLPAAYFDSTTPPPLASRAKTVWLDSGMLNRSGMGKFNLFFDRSFVQEAGADLDLSPGAELNISTIGSPSTGVLVRSRSTATFVSPAARSDCLRDDNIVIGDRVTLERVRPVDQRIQ